jgi:hypothetical protein
MAKSTIETDLFEKGFAHLTYSESKNLAGIISSLGSIVQTTEIRENPKSTRLLSSNQGMNYHTDHHVVKYIAWFCHSQSAIGGKSLLIVSKEILNGFTASSLSLLQEVSVNTHQIFLGDKISMPLLSMEESATTSSIYYAQWLVNNPASAKHQNALSKFEEGIKAAQPSKLLLSEGEVLIIDNQRMLHGREGFPSRSNRWLTRYWIKEHNN